jgi:hypothetical protein
VIGDIGPGGGIVYHVNTTGFSCGPTLSATCYYLEVAPTTETSAWTDAQRSWSTGTTNQGATVTNADGTAIGTGYRNSVAIVAQSGNVAATSAAVAARAYRGPNNLSDWYLPSESELDQLYVQRTAVGVFVDNVYWSSSEFMPNGALWQSFSNGTKGPIGKNLAFYVRPVRAF